MLSASTNPKGQLWHTQCIACTSLLQLARRHKNQPSTPAQILLPYRARHHQAGEVVAFDVPNTHLSMHLPCQNVAHCSTTCSRAQPSARTSQTHSRQTAALNGKMNLLSMHQLACQKAHAVHNAAAPAAAGHNSWVLTSQTLSQLLEGSSWLLHTTCHVLVHPISALHNST